MNHLVEPDQLWTVVDVAKYLQTSRSWVYGKVAEGILPCRRACGLLRFKPAEVRAWFDAQQPRSNVVELKSVR